MQIFLKIFCLNLIIPTIIILNIIFNVENCLCQWLPDTRLTYNSDVNWTCHNNAWCVASCDNFVHVIWYDLDAGHRLFYKRSTDGGINWGNDIQITSNPAISYEPCISVAGSIVHIVWYDYRDMNTEIYYKRSTNSGTSWEPDVRLTNSLGDSRSPSVAVSASNVHVVWEDNREGMEIRYNHSTNAGISWENDLQLTNSSAQFPNYPSVAVAGTFVHVVWQDFRNSNFSDKGEIYYKRSTDGGLSWGTDNRLTYDTNSSSYPCIAVSGSNVNVVWQDGRNGHDEIYYKHSTNGGTNWGLDTRLTNYSFHSCYPSISASGSNVHIVWTDDRDGNNEIYYKRSTDGGSSWEVETRLTNNSGYSDMPFVSTSESAVHVIWTDDRNINWTLYYKRNPTGNPSLINSISSKIPKNYLLSQNYPNPFNPNTTIKFSVPMRSPTKAFGDDRVLLKVFDILGKEVTTLINEKLSPGTYEINWNAFAYPSGIYFYRLIANDYIQTKKMILLK